MSQLVRALLRHNALAVAAQAVVFSAIGGIALIFAWMSPSLRESELAVWEALPPDMNVAFRTNAAEPSCLVIYSAVTVLNASGAVIGHPDVAIVGSEAAGRLDLPPLAPGDAAVDAVAATQLGANGRLIGVHVGVGDRVDVRLVQQTPPVRLHASSQGTLFVEALPTSVTDLYGHPDMGVCFGEDGSTAARLAATIRNSHAQEGLASATEAFAAVAGLAWGGTLLAAAFTRAVRRRPLLRLLRALGQRDLAIGPAVVGEVAAAATIALLLSTALALTIRTYVLHMWTSPTAQAATIVAGAALTVISLAVVIMIAVRWVRL